MKITFVNYFAGLGGGNRVLFELVNGLIAKGHDVEYHALQAQKWFPLKTEIKVSANQQQLEQSIPESDILVATWCMTAYIVDSLKGRKGIPAYYCQHYEPIFFFNPQEQALIKQTYNLPLNLIANSPWLAKQLEEKHNRKSELIVPGVDQKIFQPMTTLPHDKLRVLTFASPTPFKGFYDTTLPALNMVWRALGETKVEFHIFGADKMQIPYDWGSKVVRHSGVLDVDLAKLYSECDLYVGGSWAESSPLPPLEAMACGCPVVFTEFGTEHYGSAIARVKPRRPRELGAKIIELLEKPEVRVDMSKQGLADVKPFTWQSTIDNVEVYFKELLGE